MILTLKTRIDRELYEGQEFSVLVDLLLRGDLDILYDAEKVAEMIETWLQKFDPLILWRLERVNEVDMY